MRSLILQAKYCKKKDEIKCVNVRTYVLNFIDITRAIHVRKWKFCLTIWELVTINEVNHEAKNLPKKKKNTMLLAILK